MRCLLWVFWRKNIAYQWSTLSNLFSKLEHDIRMSLKIKTMLPKWVSVTTSVCLPLRWNGIGPALLPWQFLSYASQRGRHDKFEMRNKISEVSNIYRQNLWYEQEYFSLNYACTNCAIWWHLGHHSQGDGLLPAGADTLLEHVSTLSRIFCGIHLRATSQEMPMNLIRNMWLQIALRKLTSPWPMR